MGVYQFKCEQRIKADLDQVWNFISDPKNLSKITPKDMGFIIETEELPKAIYPGLIVQYTVKPLLNIPTKWVTEITHVKEGSYFVDEQRIGPYSMWHHEHILEEENGEVIMKDIISYRPPFGFLGKIANSLIIKNRLKSIFEFRRQSLNTIFPENV